MHYGSTVVIASKIEEVSALLAGYPVLHLKGGGV